MHYCLQDHSSKAVILITDNLFVAKNIQYGIIDCFLNFVDDPNTIQEITENINYNRGISLSLTGILSEVDLEMYAYVKEKIWLARIRQHCFNELLSCVNKKRLQSLVGFTPIDHLVINYSLNNDQAIEEYSTVLGIPIEFAKKELSMISESVMQEHFRIFTISSMLKEKINKIDSPDKIQEMIKFIRNSFVFSGIPNV